MTDPFSLNEDETVHCYACNHDSPLRDVEVHASHTIGARLVALVRCLGCGRPGEVHLERGDRATAAELRALALLVDRPLAGAGPG